MIIFACKWKKLGALLRLHQQRPRLRISKPTSVSQPSPNLRTALNCRPRRLRNQVWKNNPDAGDLSVFGAGAVQTQLNLRRVLRQPGLGPTSFESEALEAAGRYRLSHDSALFALVRS